VKAPYLWGSYKGNCKIAHEEAWGQRRKYGKKGGVLFSQKKTPGRTTEE